MRLFLLVSLTMIAFAANSVLNRMALNQGAIDPAGFALVRLFSGAIFLWAATLWKGGHMTTSGTWGVLSLSAYMLGFSFAYLSLGTGIGALILFGGVQITMFLGALFSRENLPPARWIGAAIAFSGLVYLLWPQGAETFEISTMGAAMMVLAAVGWGVYSLLGRHAVDPLATTAGNFVYAIPLALIAVAVTYPQAHYSPSGVLLAVLSGVVTSGMGYALWYAVLPRIPASIAAISMLTVPVIASLGGVVLVGESLGLKLVIATALVIVGVLVSLKPSSVTAQK